MAGLALEMAPSVEAGPQVGPVSRSASRLNHRRLAVEQRIWIGFGGRADQRWMRFLAPGFRHCFAALRDEDGWTVLDPLSGRLMVTRLSMPAEFDLPGFWARAGHTVLGPFTPAAPRASWPLPMPANCVGIVRALLGPGAPLVWTPRGLHEALKTKNKNKSC